MCCRILDEDKDNPPYILDNRTKHEIYYRQKIKLK